ncbi:MAG: hypothetical protein K9N46_03875 [Candidatus Marinimicrobia bacterium]|nr:hypothetical protein [Candidatus Neomarinimicrobiota bacterium]MCF7828901.1 hypothetical protein [Candidatus Neomarinimicrobiota bacterium]MCF7879861.1 hypothetical protein [Candidatus Neomarinimicrobiota bacterium]
MAVFLLVLVFGFALQLLVFVQGCANRWQAGNDLAQEAQQIHSMLYHDIIESGLVFQTDSMDIRIPVPGVGETKTYAYTDGKLSRSGMALLPESAMLDSVTISLHLREARTGKDTLFTFRPDSAYTIQWQPPDTLHYTLSRFDLTGTLISGDHSEKVNFTHTIRHRAFHPVAPGSVFVVGSDSISNNIGF